MKFISGPEHSAKHLGSGDVDVFSTPSMIQFMEEACRIFVDKHLDEGLTTVGIHVDIYHLKAAPVGAKILIKAKLLAVDGKRLVFWVEAWWKDKKIGHGLHERYVVDKAKFTERLKGELNA